MPSLSDTELVRNLQNIENGLTGWEMDFIESISKQVAGGKALTEKQRDKAEDIYTRCG